MGCSGNEKEQRGNAGLPIVKIDVSKVPPIPEEEKEEFSKEYISNAYLHEGEEGFKERLENSISLMYKRWDWLQNNPKIYVNMLRVKGFTDEQIQDCLDGKRPLAFPTREIHLEFRRALKELKDKLENEFQIRDVWFVQTGSSVPGYSANPLKGFADRPSKLTDVQTSDTDIVIITPDFQKLIDIMAKKNLKYKHYPCVTDRTNSLKISRTGTRNLSGLSEYLGNFEKEWTEKLPGGVQFTFENGNPTPIIPPWERAIDIDNI